MKVIVNGAELEIADGTTVRGLVEQNKLSVDKVAIEVNKRLVRTAARTSPGLAQLTTRVDCPKTLPQPPKVHLGAAKTDRAVEQSKKAW